MTPGQRLDLLEGQYSFVLARDEPTAADAAADATAAAAGGGQRGTEEAAGTRHRLEAVRSVQKLFFFSFSSQTITSDPFPRQKKMFCL